eukprot:gene26805-biopygen17385
MNSCHEEGVGTRNRVGIVRSPDS